MRKYNPHVSHKPPASQKGEWIGIEIECFMPFRRLKIKKKEGYFDHYGDWNRGEYSYPEARKALGKLLKGIPNITIKDDGSIKSPDEEIYFEVELSILINRNDYSPLQRLCKVLKTLDAQVNDSCGLHIHLDCRDLGFVKRIRSGNTSGSYYLYEGPGREELLKRGSRLGKVIPLMEKMVDASRLDNEYCECVEPRLGSGKYRAINMDAFLEHKTIEIRLHEGTLDFKTIHNWAEFLYFVSRNKIESEVVYDFESFKKELPESPKQILQYVKRQAA